MKRLSGWILAAFVAIAFSLVAAGPAAAHLDLVRTTPSDASTSNEPVKQVRLKFNVAGALAGPGIVILNGAGEEVPATIEAREGGSTWVVKPRAALTDGRYGVKWSVAAPDAHPKTGAFRFTVVASVATGPAVTPGPVDGSDALDQMFHELEGSTAVPETVRWLGSAAALAGAVLGIGGLVFLALVMAGRRSEVSVLARRVRRAGALLVGGTVIQLVAHSAVVESGDWAGAAPAGLGAVLSGSFGWSMWLRLLGGVLIMAGTWAADKPAPSAAMATTDNEGNDPIVRATLAKSWGAVVGAGLCLASFLLDGHTASATPLLLVWTSDVVHVLAAATWVGGIVMLATVLWQRKRAHHALDAAYLAVRFSVVAGVSLLMAGLAGIALTIGIIDEPSQLWASAWGQVLIAKATLVAVVAAIGTYNHFRLIPLLEQAVELRTNHPHPPEEPGPATPHPAPPAGPTVAGGVGIAVAAGRVEIEAANDRISRRLWFTASVEVLLLLGVIAMTAWLVGASANV